MIEQKLEHLQMIVLTALFNPLLLGLLVVVFVIGKILGMFMPWEAVVKPMLIIFVIGLVAKLFLFSSGYDLYFMFGFPFMAGIWSGAKK